MRINCRKINRPVGFRGEGPAAWAWCPYTNQKITYERCKECKFFMGEAADVRERILGAKKKDERWVKKVNVDYEDIIKEKDREIEWLKEEIERMKGAERIEYTGKEVKPNKHEVTRPDKSNERKERVNKTKI